MWHRDNTACWFKDLLTVFFFSWSTSSLAQSPSLCLEEFVSIFIKLHISVHISVSKVSCIHRLPHGYTGCCTSGKYCTNVPIFEDILSCHLSKSLKQQGRCQCTTGSRERYRNYQSTMEPPPELSPPCNAPQAHTGQVHSLSNWEVQVR